MPLLRRLTQSAPGMIACVVLSLCCVAAGFIAIKNFVSSDSPEGGHSAWYVCTETGKAFKHENKEGEMSPVYSPYSGKNTGLRAEACYWTAAGEPKTEPTWVLLNEQLGKTGPTFCPDCGRLVVGHNPAPYPGAKPPPTQKEYEARHRQGSP